MGKLGKLLTGVRRGGQGFGFTARREETSINFVVMAALPELDADLAKAVVGAGADALLLAPAEAAQVAKVEARMGDLLAAAAERPCGLLVGGEAPAASVWREGGLDFLVISPDAPAALWRGPGERVVQVGLDFDPLDVRALDALGVDAYVIEIGQRAGQPLRVRDLARYRLLAGMTSKPVLVGIAGKELVHDLDVIFQTGAEGIVLAPTVVGARPDDALASVATFREAAKKLGPRRPLRRPEEEVPLVPRVIPQSPGPEEITLPEEPEFPE